MKKALFIALACFMGFLALAFTIEARAQEDLLNTLNAQIEKARTQLDKKQQEDKGDKEVQARRELKKEARKKYINYLFNEASNQLRRRNYSRAQEVYERLLILDPQAKEEITKKLDFCSQKISIAEQMQTQELVKREEKKQLNLAKQLAESVEKKEKQEKEKAQLSAASQVRQHLSLGNEYFKNKNYFEASEEFESVLGLEPGHGEAIAKLAKAKTLLSKGPDNSYKSTKARTALHNQMIKDGFKEALKSLEANDYNHAQAAFTKVLENINNLSIESAESKTVRQIKEGAQKGPEEILSYIRSDKYEQAKRKLWELIQKTANLARERQEKQKQEKGRLLTESYLKNASEYLDKSDYEHAKAELQKVISLEPENQEANTLIGRLEDIIAITKEAK